MAAILAGAMGASLGVETTKPDFFDVIGLSPAEVAVALPGWHPFEDVEQLSVGFVGLPMAEGHRKEFMTSLQTAGKTPQAGAASARLCLLNLLEEDERYDEALALCQAGSIRTPEDAMRQVRLLWLTGKEAEGGALCARLADLGQGYDGWHSPVQIDLIKNRMERALKFLTFLESQAAVAPSIRHVIALHHLDLARRQGADVMRWIEQSSSPVLRAVWLAALGKKDEALSSLAAADAISRSEDLQLLLIALGPEPLLVERAKSLLATDKLSVGQRTALLEGFTKNDQRFELWAGMPTGHGDSVESLGLVIERPSDNTDPFSSTKRWLQEDPFARRPRKAKPLEYRRICLDLLSANPTDGRLQMLAAVMSENEPDHGKPFLLQAARHVREKPKNPSWFADPAACALMLLVPLVSAPELDQLLIETPGFAELPAIDQLRYQIIAGLDTRVVAAFAACQFGHASQDALSGEFADYFSDAIRERALPPETLALLLDRLPELVCGSEARVPSAITDLARTWIGFLSTEAVPEQDLAKAINRLFAAVAKRGPEVHRSVLNALPETIWSLRGLEVSRPEVTPAVLPGIPDWWSAMGVFAPANLLCGECWSGRGVTQMHLYASSRMSYSREQRPELNALLTSPWEQNITAALGRSASESKSKSVLASKIRYLFDDTHPRAMIYDLLVETRALPCADPAVRALAERRLAILTSKPQEEPEVAIYLFLRQLAHNQPLEQALTAFQGVPRLLPMARNRVQLSANHARERLQRIPGAYEAFMQQLGLLKPAKQAPQRAPTPLRAYDRLQLYIETGKLTSPECIALARDVLFQLVDSKRRSTEAEENLAITAMVQAGKFAAFLDEVKSRMAAEGNSEVDVQRALHSLHLYKIIHSHGETLPYAKRIFQLDPTDGVVAGEVLEAATRDQDRPLVLKCLETLCRQSRSLLCRALCSHAPLGLRQLFTGPAARELTQALLRIPLAPPERSSETGQVAGFLPLYQHLLENDPENLKPIMRWAGAISITNTRELLQVAEQAKRMQRPQDGVEILAEAFFKPPPVAANESLRFPKPVLTVLPDENMLYLTELAEGGWFKPLLEASAAFPPSPATDGVRLLIGLAADPQVATWERLVPPFLTKQPLSSRAATLRQLDRVLGLLPDTSALRLTIAKGGQSTATEPATLYSITARLWLAVEAADKMPLAPLWDEAQALFGKARPYDRLQFFAGSASPMAMLAEDAVWTDFLTSVRAQDGFTEEWLRIGRQEWFSTLPAQRRQDLAAVILSNLKPDPHNRHDLTYIFGGLVAVDAPDIDLLRKIRPWLEPDPSRGEKLNRFSPHLQLLDLLCGDARAVSPGMFVRSEGNASWEIRWSLAGHDGAGEREACLFGQRLPFLDGQFDLDILAGPTVDRMERVATVGKAASIGKQSVKMPEGTRFVSLLATQHDGGIVRWTQAAALEDPGELTPVKLAPVAFDGPGATVETRAIPGGGPFFQEDALSLTSARDVMIELARLPWSEGPAPVLAGWIMNESGSGDLSLSFRSADNKEIGNRSLGNSYAESLRLPMWQRFATREKVMPPAETDAVVLAYKPDSNKVRASIRVADVRAGSHISSLPSVGFVPLARLRAEIRLVALDPGEMRFALASPKQGVGVFDLTNNQFSGWIPLGKADREDSSDLIWMGLAGDRLVVLAGSGVVHVVSVSKRSSKAIGKIDASRFSSDERESLMTLSSDGKFLAWAGRMAGMHLARLGEDGLAGERMLETGRIESLRFTVNPNTLEASYQGNCYLLPLDDWEKAALQTTFDASRVWLHPPPGKLLFGRDARVDDARYQVSFVISPGHGGLAEMQQSSRVVYLPSGVVAVDQEGKPFHISAFGQIYRIETTQLKGYTAPGRK